MSDIGETMFPVNELIVIHSALQTQIEDCQEYLMDSSISINTKPQIAESLKYSKSALDRLNTIFSELGIDPEKTE